MAILLAYLFYFIAASASPLQRRWLAVNRDASQRGQVHFAFQIMLMLVFFGFGLPFFQPFFIRGSIFNIILLALICGISGAGYFISSYVAQKHVDAGITSLVSNIYTPITIFLATVFLNEKLTYLQIIGTVLLLISMLIISKKHRIGRFHFDKYFLLMVTSGILLGILLTAERALQKTTGFTAGTMFSWWAQCAILGIATIFFKSKSNYNRIDIAITGVLRFLQALSWVVLVFIVGNLSVVSAITTFKVVVVFAAAALFLHEREDLPRKIIGSSIAIAGLLLMK